MKTTNNKWSKEQSLLIIDNVIKSDPNNNYLKNIMKNERELANKGILTPFIKNIIEQFN